MSDMKDFKKMADEVMMDLNVTESMKERVVQRCVPKRRFPAGRLIATAACGALILGILNFSGVLQFNKQPVQQEDQGPSIFSATDGMNESYPEQTAPGQAEPGQPEPGQPEVNIMNEPAALKDWMPGSAEEAGRSFGDGFLKPGFIPEGFRQDSIFASGTGYADADKIILSYTAEDRTYMVIEQKTVYAGGFENYEAVDINGTEGFMKPDKQGSGDGLDAGGAESAIIPDTEVHWFRDGVRYSVAGLITREDALKVARSMK